ncbi:MAG TPA: hypothetical protein VKA10_08500, partial [Prolixibacteraceae bacterium]|nr:hypothetical protein [Prolixibacteraceae bacterium]
MKLKLLPAYFKKIGSALLLLSIFIFFSTRFIAYNNIEMVNELTKTGLLVSLFIMAIAKDKVENDLTTKIRINSFATAFIFGVAFFIFHPLANLLFDGSYVHDMEAFQL